MTAAGACGDSPQIASTHKTPLNVATVYTLPATTSSPTPNIAATGKKKPNPVPQSNSPTTKSIVAQSVLSDIDVASSSATIAVSPNGNLVVTVNPDSNSITLVDAVQLTVLAEIHVGDHPRSIAITPDSQHALITNFRSGTLSIVDLQLLAVAMQYPVGPMPYGVVTDGIHAYITEFSRSTINVFSLFSGSLIASIPVNPFPSGIALSSDGQLLLVSHLFTGLITSIHTPSLTVTGTASTGQDIGLSQFIAVSADTRKAYLPQTRYNTGNTSLLFDTTVFPVVNVLDLDQLQLIVRERITLDTADEPVNMPFAATFSPNGQILYIANAGSNDVSVINLTTNRGIDHLNVGSNPRGIAITPNGEFIFTNNVLDGTLSVIDTSKRVVTNTISVTEIPLSSQVLLGKKLFNSSAETRLTTDNWISCATCHFDGMMDTHTWLGFPDGPRNTPALFQIQETLPLHWSGDFDEIQDVEITIQQIQFGNGLIGKEANDALGTPHSGLSADLDSLSAYLSSIETPISPHSGDLEDIGFGRSIFEDLGCSRCHVPPIYTDRLLHDVGTGDPVKEHNSHGHGTDFDTPSLRGVWLTAPYFHDGSAATLRQVLQTGTVHNVLPNIDPKELSYLITFMMSLPIED